MIDPDNRYSFRMHPPSSGLTIDPVLIRGASSPLIPVAPSAGLDPPGPYCRWQDRLAAASIRDQVQRQVEPNDAATASSGESSRPPRIAQLTTWSIAWNDDPQPLLVLRQLIQEGLVDAAAITPPRGDIHSVTPVMRGGLVDAVVVPMRLTNQWAAAAVLPVASETGVAVVIDGPIDDLDDGLRRRLRGTLNDFGLAEHYTPVEAAVGFIRSHRSVRSVLVSSEEAAVVAGAMAKPPLPMALVETLRRYHGT